MDMGSKYGQLEVRLGHSRTVNKPTKKQVEQSEQKQVNHKETTGGTATTHGQRSLADLMERRTR